MLIISSKCQRFNWVISRSSRLEVFFKRDVLENFTKFTGNPLYWSLFLIKLQPSIPQLYLKKRLQQHKRFTMNFTDFQEHLGCLVFTILREVPHCPFFSVGFFNKTLLMKIFGDIFAMPVAKEQKCK